MIFNFLLRNTSDEIETATRVIRLGQSICGLQLRGVRPQTVTLNQEELAYLLRNPDYTLRTVLLALSSTEMPK